MSSIPSIRLKVHNKYKEFTLSDLEKWNSSWENPTNNFFCLTVDGYQLSVSQQKRVNEFLELNKKTTVVSPSKFEPKLPSNRSNISLDQLTKTSAEALNQNTSKTTIKNSTPILTRLDVFDCNAYLKSLNDALDSVYGKQQ